MVDQIQKIADQVLEFFVTYSFQIVGGLLILIAGFILGNILAKLVTKLCKKREIDVTLERFFAATTKLLVVVMFLVIAINKPAATL